MDISMVGPSQGEQMPSWMPALVQQMEASIARQLKAQEARFARQLEAQWLELQMQFGNQLNLPKPDPSDDGNQWITDSGAPHCTGEDDAFDTLDMEDSALDTEGGHRRIVERADMAVQDGLIEFSPQLGIMAPVEECSSSLNNLGELLLRERMWIPESEPLQTPLVQIYQIMRDSTPLLIPDRISKEIPMDFIEKLWLSDGNVKIMDKQQHRSSEPYIQDMWKGRVKQKTSSLTSWNHPQSAPPVASV
jgi:hypothetical protein